MTRTEPGERGRRVVGSAGRLAAAAAVLLLALPVSSAFAAGGSSSTLPASPGNKSPASKPRPPVATFGVQTSGATHVDTRGYFSYGGTDGGHISDYVAVINFSNIPLQLVMNAADAENTVQGGFSLKSLNDKATDVGSWIALPAADRVIDLPPRSQKIIPFTVAIPQSAIPGDHFGGITATLRSAVKGKTGAQYQLLQSVGARVLLRVSGPLHPSMSVSNLAVKYEGTLNPVGTGTAVLTYAVKNTGNVGLGGQQKVYVTGLFGSKTVGVGVPNIPLLLPGSTVNETVKVHGVRAEFRETAHVSITPLYIAGTSNPPSGPFTATLTFWAVPWILVAIVVLILGGLGFYLWRRRRRKGGSPQDGPADTTPPASESAPDGQEGDSSIATAPAPDAVPGGGDPLVPAGQGTSESDSMVEAQP